MPYAVFDAFKSVIPAVKSVHDERLTIAASGTLRAQYSVFDYVNENARVVIMGITPGELQANEALSVARNALLSGLPDLEVLKRSKVAASFAGAMRKNLVLLMDHIGIAKGLGVPSCSTLWGEHSSLVHFTSALRYPIFSNDSNYSGSNPKVTSSSFLKDQVLRYTGEELRRLGRTLLIPLGPSATDAARIIVAEKGFPDRNVVFGVPHPSGANAERISYFLGRKNVEHLSSKTDPAKIDQGRRTAKSVVDSFFG